MNYCRSKSTLTGHMRLHTGECKYECSFCNMKMSTRSHLVAHERIHTGQKPYACTFCSKVSISLESKLLSLFNITQHDFLSNIFYTF